MKMNVHYIIGMLSLALVAVSCKKYEPDFFDEGANGAYFDYAYASDFDKTLNFSDHIVGDPDTVSVTLKIKLLGYLQDEARTLSVKTKAIEGYEPADVTIDDVVFSNKEYEKNIEVKVKRPEKEDVMYAVCIYLDGSGDIGSGINGKEEINLYVTESYEMPVVWYSHMQTFLGTWSREKHIYLAKHTGNNRFYTELYDESLGQHVYDSILALNVSAVNALLAKEPEEAIVVDLPILNETDHPNYTEPYFWKDYEEYLHLFNASKFCRFTTMLGGSNTKDVAALFESDAGRQKMVEKTNDFHKSDVLDMLNAYYEYAQLGYPISTYKERFWVEMKMNATYDVRIPFWWEDPNGLGTGEVVKKYFGEYNDYKYLWMLKKILEKDGSEEFVAASLFPFICNEEGNGYTYDQVTVGNKQLNGEVRLKECYRIIKEKYDEFDPESSIKEKIGIIPEVLID